MKLAEFMKEQLAGKRGSQARFVRKAEISEGTVSKWAQGGMDRAPNFENCLRIAVYFKVQPAEVFEMAERPEYGRLFDMLYDFLIERKMNSLPEVKSKPEDLKTAVVNIEELYSLNKRAFIGISKSIDDRLDEERERTDLSNPNESVA